MIRNKNSETTDFLHIEQSGFYELKGTTEFAVTENAAWQLPCLVARLIVRKPNSLLDRTIHTCNVRVSYNIASILDQTSAGYATYETTANLERGDLVRIEFSQPNPDEKHATFDFETRLDFKFKWGDGYDDIPTTEYEIRDFELVEMSLDTVVQGDPDASLALYQPSEYSVMTVADGESRMIKMYDDNKEIISINCRTGEINFAPELKEPYKMMWLKFQEAFPEAFKSHCDADITHVDSESRKLKTGWILENAERSEPDSHNYDRAMEFLK
jgi:hypothetical protein